MGSLWRKLRPWQLALLAGPASLLLFNAYSFEPSSGPAPTAELDGASLLEASPGLASGLPQPSRVSLRRMEEQLFRFLNDREYARRGWLRDKRVRDTGPYIAGKSYGTHPAVRVYYSPGVVRWLANGRRGKIPDGEVIVKEQYPPPAARHFGKTEEELARCLESWAVMVKDSSGAHDGWFWSSPSRGQCAADGHRYPFAPPVSGFGLYCVRCHASAHTPGTEPADEANELTFAALRNITGFPGQPILYRVDDSWRHASGTAGAAGGAVADAPDSSHRRCPRPPSARQAPRVASADFLSLFRSIDLVPRAGVLEVPPATHDWVSSRRGGGSEMVTSSQCMACHAGLVGPFGPSLFIPAGKSIDYGGDGWDVSPYGEWRWTPMGLAGRDPFFYAQLEGEVRWLRDDYRARPALGRALAQTLTDACLRCHGVMGKWQHDRDRGTGHGAALFSLDHVQAVAADDEAAGHGGPRYGALARDGVGCVVCHRMQPPVQPASDPRPPLQYFLETSLTGNFQLGKRGEVYGPFEDDALAPYAMEHATGLRPRYSPFLKSSRLCGTCHAVSLPTLDHPLGPAGTDGHIDELTRSETVPLFRQFHHHVEQATYLEWLNSEYENEIDRQNPRGKSCQDCHMSAGLKDDRRGIDLPQVRTRIAAIQDTTYPESEGLADHELLQVRVRERGYRRHNFAGLNAFLLELFRQLDDVLGVPKTDFMTGSGRGIDQAIDGLVHRARHEVVSLKVEAGWRRPGKLAARVLVSNKVGHRFPSGVGFRRAFLELKVIQPAGGERGRERVVWASGCTNALGVLLGPDGRPLPTELFTPGQQRYQKHHQVITRQDQVQIYETLLRDARGKLTTSFVRGGQVVKDNRLLPRGWRREGPGGGLAGKLLRATHPGADVADDPRYQDGSGCDEVSYEMDIPDGVKPDQLRVRATLYYQAVPPYYLHSLFAAASDGPATRRLHYLCSHAKLKGTPIEGWKLPLSSATCPVPPLP